MCTITISSSASHVTRWKRSVADWAGPEVSMCPSLRRVLARLWEGGESGHNRKCVQATEGEHAGDKRRVACVGGTARSAGRGLQRAKGPRHRGRPCKILSPTCSAAPTNARWQASHGLPLTPSHAQPHLKSVHSSSCPPAPASSPTLVPPRPSPASDADTSLAASPRSPPPKPPPPPPP
jgi:hypothetical protein